MNEFGDRREFHDPILTLKVNKPIFRTRFVLMNA